MAEVDYDAFEVGERPAAGGSSMFKVINWLGGVTSLALIAGLGYWGYDLMMRDVTGVPVVQALEGPFREAPADPGGTLAEHQGLSVNEVTGSGTAGGLPPEIVLAPDAMALADEDLPVAALPQVAPSNAFEEAADLAASTVEDTPDDALATDRAVAEALQSSDDPAAQALALAEALTEGVTPLSSAAAPDQVAAVEPAPEPAPLATPEALGGLLSSPRPVGRPASLRGSVEVASAAPGVAPETVEALAARQIDLAVADIPAGTRLVQLGAFDSPEVARDQWGKISARFENYFDGKRRVVQEAQAGGKTFWRLRAEGFADLSDARHFCTALTTGGAECIPVVVR